MEEGRLQGVRWGTGADSKEGAVHKAMTMQSLALGLDSVEKVSVLTHGMLSKFSTYRRLSSREHHGPQMLINNTWTTGRGEEGFCPLRTS